MHTFTYDGENYSADTLPLADKMTTADGLRPLLPSQWKPRTALAS
jgi:hypothetical protein